MKDAIQCGGNSPQGVRIARMKAADVPVVAAIERSCFTSHWEPGAYYNELTNPAAVYFVARKERTIVGFAGMWVALDEAHLTLVGVLPEYRRCGIGISLVVALLRDAISRGATRATLEVRERNEAALQLYLKLGFRSAGRREGYYVDTGEAATIMWAEEMDGEAFAAALDGAERSADGRTDGVAPATDPGGIVT